MPLAFSSGLVACADAEDGGWPIGFALPALAATARGDGETPAGSYLVGRFALDAGDFPQAAAGFERALEADPDNLELRRQVFALLVAGGELERAVANARELVELDPGADEASLLLALDEARAGDLAAAATRLQAMSTGGLAGTVRPILLAWAQFGTGDAAAAIATLAEPDPRGGLDRLHAYHRAIILGLEGRPREGLSLLETSFGEVGSAPPRVARAGAELAAAAGDRAAADRILAQARAADPDGRFAGDGAGGAIRTAADGMGDALVEIAEALADQEGAAQALLFARLATFVRPEDASGLLVVAAVGLRQDNATQALRALEAVPAASPLAREAGFLKAQALDELGRTDEAIALLERMIDDAPDRPEAAVALGDLLRAKERYAEAEVAYTKAIERLPEGERRNWRLFYARGIALERTKRWPAAEFDLLRALELEPEQPLVLNYLGYSWVDQHQNLDRAKAMLHRAVDLRPEDGFITDSLGWAYYRLGEYPKAVTYLERAVELEAGDPVINDHLGDAYWRVGRMREARFQWERALTFEPEAELVGTIRAKLANGLPDAAPRRG